MVKKLDNVKYSLPTGKHISDKIAKVIRVATIPSVAASLSLCVMYAYDSALS